jgi:ABC-type transport system involved in cytochrome c biogenesis permease subunit
MKLQRQRVPWSTGSLLLILVAMVLLVGGVALTWKRGGHPDAVLFAFILGAFAALRASRVVQELAMVGQLSREGGLFAHKWLSGRQRSVPRLLSTWTVPPLAVILILRAQGRWFPPWFWVVCSTYLLLEITCGIILERRYRRSKPPTSE